MLAVLPERLMTLLHSSLWNFNLCNDYNYITYTYTWYLQQPYNMQCHRRDENGKYCASNENQTHIFCITPLRLPDVTTLSMPTHLCGFLPERSVQTTTKYNIITEVTGLTRLGFELRTFCMGSLCSTDSTIPSSERCLTNWALLTKFFRK